MKKSQVSFIIKLKIVNKWKIINSVLTNFDILYKSKKLKNYQIILGSENKRKNDGIGWEF